MTDNDSLLMAVQVRRRIMLALRLESSLMVIRSFRDRYIGIDTSRRAGSPLTIRNQIKSARHTDASLFHASNHNQSPSKLNRSFAHSRGEKRCYGKIKCNLYRAIKSITLRLRKFD